MSGFERNFRYENSDSFFRMGGSASMVLTTAAARSACHQSLSHGLLVIRIEGGIWHDPGFEARIDCIWDGMYPPVGVTAAEKNNEAAAVFVEEEQSVHDAFVITTAPILGRS
jgi:hypothetical protein